MTSMIRNFGPLMGFIAAVAWLCGEQLSPPAPPPNVARTIVKIDPKLLRPDLPPPCPRNPLGPAAPEVVETTWVNAHSAAQQLGDAEASQSVPAAPLKLRLRGTFVGGLRRSAIIDDRLCFEGDYLPGAAAAAEGAFRLTHVDQDYVVLRTEDQDFRLEYSP